MLLVAISGILILIMSRQWEMIIISMMKGSVLFGVDGWLTAEYRSSGICVIVSLNLKPYLEITIPAFVRLMPQTFWIFHFLYLLNNRILIFPD